jgi:hypothetical protein
MGIVSARLWWFNRMVSKNQRPENTQQTICVASAAVRNKTGNFDSRIAQRSRPHRACLKAFLEGIPVPVAGREYGTPFRWQREEWQIPKTMKTSKIIYGIALTLTCSLMATLKAQTNIYVTSEFSIGEYGLNGQTNNSALISGLGAFNAIAISGNYLFAAHGGNFPSGTAPAIGEYITSGAPIATPLITNGSSSPQGIAISGTNLFVLNGGTIGEYTTSGQTINSSLISGLYGANSIAISGNDLFVTIMNGSTFAVGEYTLSGATVNASLITYGLNGPTGIAISGSDLFVANWYNGTIGEYTTSGQTINTSLISGLAEPEGIAILGNDLFVVNQNGYNNGYIGEYTLSGATINSSLISGLSYAYGIAIGPLPTPQLNIATVGNQSVLLYPTWAANYVLQRVTNLASTNWLPVSNGVPVIAVTVTNNLPASFYRLAPAE